MICVAIAEPDINKCLQILDEVDLAEIRIDLTGFGTEQLKKVFAHKTPAVATCRPDKMGFDKQFELLSIAIESGAKYVDIETEAPEFQQKRLIDLARKHSCRIIISYHNYDVTPGLRDLYEIMDTCYDQGADVAKLAVMAYSREDAARILSLYSNGKPLIALGMGEAGKVTRIISPLLGAEFTFAAVNDSTGTAPGQISYNKLKELITHLKNV